MLLSVQLSSAKPRKYSSILHTANSHIKHQNISNLIFYCRLFFSPPSFEELLGLNNIGLFICLVPNESNFMNLIEGPFQGRWKNHTFKEYVPTHQMLMRSPKRTLFFGASAYPQSAFSHWEKVLPCSINLERVLK